jgi:sensor histidine kinase YesM
MAVGATEMMLYGGTLIPLTAAFYFFAYYYLIPKLVTLKRPVRSYILWVLGCLAIAFVPVMLLVMSFCDEEEVAVGFSFFNSGFQLLLTAPLTWNLYKRRVKSKEQIGVLQTELGQSTANLDFLRSQINPHFLFNSLNTLYGTALQENSERTAQGIQMLGDMMRFMLHENHQRHILLTRELEYMRNYIELQSLRTSTSPNITIETSIEDVNAEKWIAPMLLIPFVENAFKHGISLKRKSWIRVTLHYEADKLYFDVYNSTHPKQELDLEKDHSGVGLENVRQRLALLYPGKHELLIRETPQEFFVHLTLQLSGNTQQ